MDSKRMIDAKSDTYVVSMAEDESAIGSMPGLALPRATIRQGRYSTGESVSTFLHLRLDGRQIVCAAHG